MITNSALRLFPRKVADVGVHPHDQSGRPSVMDMILLGPQLLVTMDSDLRRPVHHRLSSISKNGGFFIAARNKLLTDYLGRPVD